MLKGLFISSLLISSAFAEPVNNIGKTQVSEASENIAIQIQLLQPQMDEAEIAIRSTPDYLQVEIPGLITTQGQQLYPLGKEQMKSILVAPTADQKGTRVKFVFRQKGTVDPSAADVIFNHSELAITLPKKALQARLRTNEAVRNVLIGRAEPKKQIPSGEAVKLVADGNRKAANAAPGAVAGPPPPTASDAVSEAETEPESVSPASTSTAATVDKPISAMAESEIPVKSEATGAVSSERSQWPRLVATAGLLIVILAGAMFFLLKYTKKKSILSQAPKMRILNQFHLGPKKQLMVVQIAGESMLLGVTDHNITFLKNLALLEEELPAQVPQDFKKTLDETTASATGSTEDEYEYQGLNEIRDRVSSRLKSMRTFS